MLRRTSFGRPARCFANIIRTGSHERVASNQTRQGLIETFDLANLIRRRSTKREEGTALAKSATVPTFSFISDYVERTGVTFSNQYTSLKIKKKTKSKKLTYGTNKTLYIKLKALEINNSIQLQY